MTGEYQTPPFTNSSSLNLLNRPLQYPAPVFDEWQREKAETSHPSESECFRMIGWQPKNLCSMCRKKFFTRCATLTLSRANGESTPIQSASLPSVPLPLNSQRFTEEEIEPISNALELIDTSWSKSPRTYIVLSMTNRQTLLDKFIKYGFNDYWLPASLQQLPRFLEHEAKIKFVQTQTCVMTDTADLTIGIGPHKHLDRDAQVLFEFVGLLGSGGFGQVEEVVYKPSKSSYAKKIIPRRVFRDWRLGLKTFMDELRVLKQLDHRHITRLVDSYTDPQYLGLIMTPVADCNLADYLTAVSAQKQEKRALRTFFGCLAAALVYLNRAQIRHKDVKPQNILVKEDTVLLTDFGLSRDWSGLSGETTEGPTPMSPRYCAPEVANYMPRNSSSDIWSLGCIFAEMVTVLKGESVQEMRLYFDSHGSGDQFFRNNPHAVDSWLSALKTIEKFSDNVAVGWAVNMLSHDRNARPTAAELLSLIQMSGSDGSETQFCGRCCSSGVVSSG